MTKTIAISTANLAALSTIVEAAKASGEIDSVAVTALIENARLEARTNGIAAYLLTQKLSVADKASVKKLAKTPSRRSIRDLEDMARPYEIAELPAMLAVIKNAKGVKMTDVERIAYDQAVAEVAFTHAHAASFRHNQLAQIMKRNGLSVAA